MAVTPYNIAHMEKVAELCVQLGVKAFTYSPVLPFGRSKHLIWDLNSIQKLVDNERKVRKNFGDIIPIVNLEHLGKNEFNINCGAGWRSVVIDPKLRIRPCVVSDSEKDVIGKISPYYPKSSFEAIKDVTSVYANLEVPNKKICKDCKFLNFCIPCPLRAREIIERDLKKPTECKWISKVENKFLKIFFKDYAL